MAGNDEYIDNHLPGLDSCLTTHGYSYTRVYAKVVFDNRYEFKRDFTPLIRTSILNMS